MRKSFSVLLFCIGLVFLGAQEKKYQSLLWEVSSADTPQKSYLYGTMHVSERVAFHLSDAFFDAILSVDRVALESNPEHWLDNMRKDREGSRMGIYYGQKLYPSFARKPIENQDLAGMLKYNDAMINGILYRTQESREDFQEQTYLDMFIYQVGKRTGKAIVSLEGYKESRDLVLKSQIANADFRPEPWVKKILKDKPYHVVLQDAYRKKDLDLLDSLHRGTQSVKSYNYMLTQRNANMVYRMDSVIQNGQSIFSAVGAAHLPGTDGMIEMLRAKGYTVKPILDDYTTRGKNLKAKLDTAFVNEKYTYHSSSDGMIKLPTPGKLHEFHFSGASFSVSPDVQNGSYVNVSRALTFDFLRKDHYTTGLKRLDSLFFENIPGKILNKRKININGFSGWEIENETASKDRQFYQVIITPLEVVVVSLLGTNHFVANQQDKIKNKTQLKPLSAEWKKISPLQKGFQVNMPSYAVIQNNDSVNSVYNSPEIYAYDPTEKAYYFVVQNTVDDIDFLEDTEFEHQRIHYRFYKELESDSTQTHWASSKKQKSFYSNGKINDEKQIYLKTVIKGPYYYLLGTTSKNKKDTFFDSFSFTEFQRFKEAKVHQDTALHFTVKTPIIPQPNLDYGYSSRADKKKKLAAKTKVEWYTNEEKRNIKVKYHQFHAYEEFKNIDSLWNDIVENNKKLNGLKLVNKTTEKISPNSYAMDAIFQDTLSLSRQRVKAKYVVNNGVLYGIKTLIDKDYNNSNEFIETFYNSFTPKDTLIGLPITQKKSPLFFEHMASNDVDLQQEALNSIDELSFTKADFSSLVKLIATYDFKEDEEKYKAHLVEKIGDTQHKDSFAYLQKFYLDNEGESNLQMAALAGLAKLNTTQAYNTLLELMEQDLPLPTKYNNNIPELFDNLEENHSKSKHLFPDIFQFYTVPEYQKHVLSFTKSLVDSGKISPKKLKKFQKMLTTQAKLEIKRAKSSATNQQNYYGYRNISTASTLQTYAELLHPLSKYKNVQDFFQKLKREDDAHISLLEIDLAKKFNLAKPQKAIDNLMKKEKNWAELYTKLHENQKLEWLPSTLSHKDIAYSFLLEAINYDEQKDSLQFLHHKTASFKDKTLNVWFYKYETESDYSANDRPRIAYIAFELDKDGNLDPNKTHDSQYLNYIDEEELEKTYEEELDKLLFEDKPRVKRQYNDYF